MLIFFDNKNIVIHLCQQNYCQMENWIAPITIAGDAATGLKYFKRPIINENFWHEVKKGNHILFVAPRRVGKSSVMKDLVLDCPEGYYCIYQDIEGVKTKDEFYQRLFELIMSCVSKIDKAKTLLNTWRKKYSITEITTSGIKIDKNTIDYEIEVRNSIPQLKDLKINVVLFLDEFAEVINKLSKKGNSDDAVAILHTIREMRHDENFRHFTLVFAGSIGLHHVVKSIDRPKIINDLHEIKIGELTTKEAEQMINQLTKDATVQYSEDDIVFLTGKIKNLLPYYIQLMLEEIDFIARNKNNPKINQQVINEAFENVSKKGSNFDDWIERLKIYLPKHYPFINNLLTHCAHHNEIVIQKIYDIASKKIYKRTEDYMDFVDQLITDGYWEEVTKHKYRFLSPFLQAFWLHKNPIYND